MTKRIEVITAVLVLLALVSNVKGVPKCEYSGKRRTELVCTPIDASDYILVRGLVSDSNITTSVSLSRCKITEIELEAFENLFYLKSIDLSKNKITTLKLGALDGNSLVTDLNLSANLISGLPLGLFDEKPNLQVLDLSLNKLASLELGIFDELRKLKDVNLSYNSLTGKDFNIYIFDRSRFIRYIDFSGNDMNDASNHLLQAFQVLEKLQLNECFLTEVPAFVRENNLKTIKQLYLTKNQLNKLVGAATFENLENLEKLDLADNVIEEVDVDVFQPLKKLKIVVLRNNKLTNLPENLFQSSRLLGNLDLSFNLISNVPVNALRNTALKNLNLSNNRFTYFIDNFCLELRNSGVKLTKFFFNQNPWQCACLRDILSEVKKFKVEYNSAQYNGEQPVCVTSGEFSCKRHDTFNDEFTSIYDNNLQLMK